MHVHIFMEYSSILYMKSEILRLKKKSHKKYNPKDWISTTYLFKRPDLIVANK